MAPTSPIGWTVLENAIHDAVAGATGIAGDRVRFVEQRDVGVPRSAPATALLEVLSFTTLFEADERRISQVMRHRYTVTASGPGTVGVVFYPGTSLTGQTISISAGAGDPPATSAAALLAQLGTDLPAGYTASADPEDTASVLVDGSSGQPLFAALPADAGFVSVTTLLERFATLRLAWSRLTWRVTLRTAAMSGVSSALALLTRARFTMQRLLDPALHAAGWKYAGTLATTATPPPSREESSAVLDFAVEGFATEALQARAIRAAGFAISTT